MRNKNVLKIALFAISLSVITVGVSAQQNQNNKRGKRPTAAELIKKMDSNNDGKLSKSEVKGPLKKDFSKMDTNSDGYLSKSELEKPKVEQKQNKKGGKQPSAAEQIKKMDSNNDGKLSKSEVKGLLKKDFSKIDANSDGYLSKSELEKYKPSKKAKKRRE